MNINTNILRLLLRNLAVALPVCLSFFVSCSQEDLGIDEGEPLPAGQYPLMLTASVEGMTTRSAGKDVWTDGDEIGVKIGAFEAIGLYKLNSDGSIQDLVEPLHWQNTASANVKAWFPYEPQIDVPLADQSAGLKDIDFLTAIAENQNYRDQVALNFKHQMAKVSCRLVKGDDITAEEFKTVKLTINGCTKASFTEGVLSGEDNGWITPTSDNQALLVPQDMTKKDFIKIDLRVKSSSGFISPKTFIYQPEEGNLQAGTHYSYTITVNKERLVIQQISGQWDDNNGSEYADEEVCRVNLPEGHGQTLTFSSNVTTEHDNEKNIDYLLVRGKEFYISYDLTDANSMKGFIPTVEDTNKITVNCSESKGVYTFRYTLKYQTVNLIYDDYVQVGDIYYSDGTWSRNKNEDKIPVGIVFRSGAAGTEDLPNYYGWAPTRIIRGYVVALADASTRKGCWGYGTNNKYLTTSYEEASSLKEGQRTKYYSGYVNTNKLRTEDPDGLYSKADVNSVSTGLWAFKVAVEYRPANIPDGDPAAPTENNGSSGWYLPSIRQLIDLANLFRLNVYLQAAGGNPFDYYANEYWSSSEYPNTKTASTNAYINRIAEMKTNWKMKTAQCYVRSVLTF